MLGELPPEPVVFFAVILEGQREQVMDVADVGGEFEFAQGAEDVDFIHVLV